MKNRIKFTTLILSGIFALICLLASCSGSANPDTPSDGKTYYKVTFDSDGGSSVATQKVESGQTATKPDAPTKTDYDFEGWFLGDTLYDFNTPVEANIKLKAKWEIAIYTITFDSDGGSDVDKKYVTAGKTVEEPDAPGKQGYGFYGWYNGETEYDFSSAVHSDLTLKAKWGPVKAKEVTNETIIKAIETLTESKVLKATGEFSHELIREVNKALKALYEEKPAVLVSLDLSEVTGLTELESVPMSSYYYNYYNNSFYECRNLESIILPNILQTIGANSFSFCSNLTSISIPKGVTNIGEEAFYDCYNLTSITIPDSVTSIGKSAFSSCYNLDYLLYEGTLEQWCMIDILSPGWSNVDFYINNISQSNITIPDSITSIGDYAFYGCFALTSITIPDSVTSIGNYAFYGCSSLTSITIPDNVTSIGDYTFNGCSSLTSITIPANVTSIGNYAFSVCSDLTSLTIPANVTSIGDYAFSNCSSLTSLTIPDSVTSIGDNIFDRCITLKEITIPFISGKLPESVKKATIIGDKIVDNAFAGCSNLTTIIISDGVTSIGNYAFKDCSCLISITIPDSVTSIGFEAFKGCSSLTNITIPDSITYIQSFAFSDCLSLKNLFYEGSLEQWCMIDIGYPGWLNVDFYINNIKQSNITIPDSFTSIGNYTFYNFSGLTSITIPNTITKINLGAFQGCSGLTSITIPDSVKSIGTAAFCNCSGLTSITIPDSVTLIERYAFENCSSLNSVIFSHPDSWTIDNGRTYLPESILSNATTAAQYLTDKYYNSDFRRKK